MGPGKRHEGNISWRMFYCSNSEEKPIKSKQFERTLVLSPFLNNLVADWLLHLFAPNLQPLSKSLKPLDQKLAVGDV